MEPFHPTTNIIVYHGEVPRLSVVSVRELRTKIH